MGKIGIGDSYNINVDAILVYVMERIFLVD